VAKKSIDSKSQKVKPAFQPSEKRRAEYKKLYDNLIYRAKGLVRIDGVHDTHHIIPSSLGGSNNSDNLVVLTYDEHFLAHWLLSKFCEGEDRYRMLAALPLFVQQGRFHHPNRVFKFWQKEVARRANIEAQRYFSTGNTYALGHKNTPEFCENQRQRMLNNSYGLGKNLGNQNAKGTKRTQEFCDRVRARSLNNTYRLGHAESPAKRLAHSKKMRGEGNPKATITESTAVQIYTTPGRNPALACIFNVSGQIVSQIKHKRTWKHIHPIPDWDYENKCWKTPNAD
jgi:hypothetical protein